MEEFNIQGKQTSFYKYCPGTFGYTLVYAITGRLTCTNKVSAIVLFLGNISSSDYSAMPEC
jgi:hypothetical protein